MSIGLGGILGSVSPAFGLASGKGLFGDLPLNGLGQSGLFGLLGLLLSHGNGGHQQPTPSQATLPGTTLPTPQPLASLPGPSLQQAASSMPTMAPGPNPLSIIGNGLKQSGGGDYSAGLSALRAPTAQPMGMSHLLQMFMPDLFA